MGWKVETMATICLTAEVEALRDQLLKPEDIALLFALEIFQTDQNWAMKFLDLRSYGAIEQKLEQLKKAHTICI